MSEPIWLELDEINAIHFAMLDAHGGLEGTRDEGLLAAAVARPQQLYASYAGRGMVPRSQGSWVL